MPEDILAPVVDPTYQETDIFLWANNLVQIKEDLKIELFFFNKNNVMYKTSRNKDLEMQLHQLLIDPILEYVLEGADNGLIVRGFEEAESEENVLQRTQVNKVDKAKELLGWLKTQEHEIEVFVEEEHDLKRLKGIVARISHPKLEKSFYIIKSLPASNVMKGSTSWLMRQGRLVKFDADGALKIPSDNQLLVLDQDIYVFSQAKLEQLFGYNAKKYGIAEKKMAEIGEQFKLSFADGISLEELVKGKKALVNKMQKINPFAVKQDALIEHADELDIGLMVDENGAIIIMDSRDLDRFINLLNDDYIESPLTGERYEIKAKRPLKPAEEDELLKQI